MFNIEEIKEELQLQICAGAPLLFQETDDYIEVHYLAHGKAP